MTVEAEQFPELGSSLDVCGVQDREGPRHPQHRRVAVARRRTRRPARRWPKTSRKRSRNELQMSLAQPRPSSHSGVQDAHRAWRARSQTREMPLYVDDRESRR
jgi:hypothetical protein